MKILQATWTKILKTYLSPRKTSATMKTIKDFSKMRIYLLNKSRQVMIPPENILSGEAIQSLFKNIKDAKKKSIDQIH